LVGTTGQSYRFIAAPGDPLDRLDKFVVASLEREGAPSSRTSVKRWIEAGAVLVDRRPGSASQTVTAGAIVDITPLPAEPTILEPDPNVLFDVLYEDEHLVVVDKPGGLVVHPARGHATGTLVQGLLARPSFARSPTASMVSNASPGDPPGGLARPGIVHRLDKGTSGILVVAKDEPTREGLKAQFARHDIERAYLAIVVGKAADATFETLHGRHRTDRLKFTTRVRSGKRAVTRVTVCERLAGDRAALVECRLETGRTHQIRVHLSECASTPVLGDPLYGKPTRDAWIEAIAERLGRQALHATVLGFLHPRTGERLHFRREPHDDFMVALRELRAGGSPKRRA
jgi:23S rRNA pseudouridine1911/1915/1917 synthase